MVKALLIIWILIVSFISFALIFGGFGEFLQMYFTPAKFVKNLPIQRHTITSDYRWQKGDEAIGFNEKGEYVGFEEVSTFSANEAINESIVSEFRTEAIFAFKLKRDEFLAWTRSGLGRYTIGQAISFGHIGFYGSEDQRWAIYFSETREGAIDRGVVLRDLKISGEKFIRALRGGDVVDIQYFKDVDGKKIIKRMDVYEKVK